MGLHPFTTTLAAEAMLQPTTQAANSELRLTTIIAQRQIVTVSFLAFVLVD